MLVLHAPAQLPIPLLCRVLQCGILVHYVWGDFLANLSPTGLRLWLGPHMGEVVISAAVLGEPGCLPHCSSLESSLHQLLFPEHAH